MKIINYIKIFSNCIQFKNLGFKFIYTFIDLFRITFNSSFIAAKKIPLIIDIEKNKIKIFGNGSSLNVHTFIYSDEFDYLVVNRFVLSNLYIKVKPKYYVFADNHFFEEEEGIMIINKIFELTFWETIIFVPINFKRNIKKINTLNTNINISILYYNNSIFRGFDFIKYFLYKKNLAMPKTQNVLVASIQLSMQMGYKTIFLYGVEHSWTKNLFVNSSNEVCMYNQRFFESENKLSQTFKEIHDNIDFKFHEILRMYAYMFESYWELRKISNRYKIKIFNYTEDSFIDAFERS